MLATLKGKVCGNTVMIDDKEYLSNFDGANVVVAILDNPQKKSKSEFTTENINKLIKKHGQSKILLGNVGLEAVRELTKNDVW